MGMLLTVRFVRAVKSLRELNQTLEQRIAEREKSLADNYLRLAYLERQNAAAEERKLIMREIHDGVGSRLFTSLSRVERGVMDAPQMADSLRACISDMRLALDALAPDDPDLLSAFGDFMFRWQAELDAVGVRCTWDIDVAGDDLRLPPHATLQVLRIAQESLTNVAKHARATHVALLLRHCAGEVTLHIEDDGRGLVGGTTSGGRGLSNMRARAEQVGARLEVGPGEAGRGVRVLVTLAC
jgi:signal transduction histidine kinase